jgi:hypothetical protein
MDENYRCIESTNWQCFESFLILARFHELCIRHLDNDNDNRREVYCHRKVTALSGGYLEKFALTDSAIWHDKY